MSTVPVPDNGILAVIAGICFNSYLYFGFYILSIAPKVKTNRAFFYSCMFNSLWSLCYVIYYLSTNACIIDIVERFIYAGTVFVILFLRFVLIYTDIIKNKKILKYILIIIWLPPLVIIYKSIVYNAVANDFPFGYYYLYTAFLDFIYNSSSLVILFIYFYKHKINWKKKQGLLLIISGIVLISMAWYSDYFFGFRGKINILPFWVLLWFSIVLYSIRKYGFISTPKLINKDISENIEEGIILLDPDLKIIYKNTALLKMLDIKDNEAVQLGDIILEKEILDYEFSSLIQSDKTSFAIRINLIISGVKNSILADAKVKKIIDAYDDITGFLIIISKVKDLEQLKERYKISARELDVIYHVVTGSKNKEIAGVLNVTESTVKSHIMNIFDKLGVKNRVELLNLLSDFNILLKAK